MGARARKQGFTAGVEDDAEAGHCERLERLPLDSKEGDDAELLRHRDFGGEVTRRDTRCRAGTVAVDGQALAATRLLYLLPHPCTRTTT